MSAKVTFRLRRPNAAEAKAWEVRPGDEVLVRTNAYGSSSAVLVPADIAGFLVPTSQRSLARAWAQLEDEAAPPPPAPEEVKKPRYSKRHVREFTLRPATLAERLAREIPEGAEVLTRRVDGSLRKVALPLAESLKFAHDPVDEIYLSALWSRLEEQNVPVWSEG